MAVLGGLDSNGIRVAGYALAAVTSLWAGVRELRSARHDPTAWPAFWFVVAGLFLAMGIGRGADLGGVISDLGRREAQSAGWYYRRRELQELVVFSILMSALIVFSVVVWRTAARHRRYLPMTIVVLSVVSFAGVRIVSLHDVDVLLARFQIGGLRLGAVVELGGIALAIVMTVRFSLTASTASEGPPVPLGRSAESEASPAPS